MGTRATAVAPDDPVDPDRPRPVRRSGSDAIGLLLLVLGAVLLAAGNVTAWAAETASDPETYEDASVLGLDEGSLSRLVRQRVSDATMDALDLDGMIAATLPGPLSALGGPAEDLGQTLVDEAIDAVLAEPAVAQLIADLEGRVDEELVAVLLDESELLHLDGDTVVLDLDPLVAEVADRIDASLPGWAQAIPGLSADTLIPDEIQSSGVEVELAEMPALAEGRSSIERLGDLAPVLFLSGGALALGGLIVARRRGRALAVFGLALAGGVALFLAGAFVWGGWPLSGIAEPLEQIAAQRLVDAGGDALQQQSLLAAGVAAVLVVVGVVWDRRFSNGASSDLTTTP